MENSASFVPRKFALVVLTVAISVCLLGCPKNRSVTAKCTSNSLDRVSADFGPTSIGNTSVGLLNTHQLAPGYLLELDPKTHSGGVPLVVSYTDVDFAPPENAVSIVKLIAMNFELTTTADLPKVVQAELTTKLAADSALDLKNGRRFTLRDPIRLVEMDQNAKARIINHPDRIYLFVSAVVRASSLELKYTKSDDVTGHANIIKIGNFSVNVHYDCKDTTSLSGDKAPVGWFYVRLKATGEKIDTDNTPVNLAEYDLSHAILIK
jgi:hypothetical protein